MNLFESLILGLVQGLTEFLPVSSSGHLTLVQNLFNITGENFHYFLEWINFGTLIAMLIYFWPQIKILFQQVFQQHDFRLALNIVITCIPAGLAGLLFSSLIESSAFFSSTLTLGIMLGLVGLIMIFLPKFSPEPQQKSSPLQKLRHASPAAADLASLKTITPKNALLIGLVQIFALLPGTSRMATTMIAGRLTGLNNKSAANYSFLVAIPLMLAVLLKNFISSGARTYLFANLLSLLLANAVAFLAGFFVLRWVMKYFSQNPQKSIKTQKLAKTQRSTKTAPLDHLQPFGYYRLALSLFVIILSLTV